MATLNAPFRIAATASSRRLHALSFIKSYWAEHGGSPSFGEIAAALRSDRPTVSRIVQSLDRSGDIIRASGSRRGILLPDKLDQVTTADALLILRRRGWSINGEAGSAIVMSSVVSVPPVTSPQLELPPELNDID